MPSKITRRDGLSNALIKEAGSVRLLTREDEINLSRRIEKSVKAQKRLESKRTGKLTRLERKKLREQIQDGQRAREQLVCANRRLVIEIAKRRKNCGVDLVDLISAGTIALVELVNQIGRKGKRGGSGFDWRRGNKFSTFAWRKVFWAVSRCVSKERCSINVPAYLFKKSKRRIVNPDLLKMGERSVANLSTLKSSDGEPFDIIDDKTKESWETADFNDKVVKVKEAMETLSEKEIDVIKRRYGLNGNSRQTLEEIGGLYGVSKERIQQIETLAIEKLKCAFA